MRAGAKPVIIFARLGGRVSGWGGGGGGIVGDSGAPCDQSTGGSCSQPNIWVIHQPWLVEGEVVHHG